MFRKLLLSALLTLAAPLAAHAANRFAVCTTTCDWTAASTAMWSTTTGGATGASVPGSGDVAIFDAATCVGGTTCTITVNHATNSVSGLTFNACTASTTGCILDFSVNNQNLATGNIDASGSGTRTLKFGTGTFSITSSGGSPFLANGTNLTLTPSTATLNFTGASGTFNMGTSITWGTVNFKGANTNVKTMTGTTFTIGTLGIDADAGGLHVAGGTSFTVTNALAIAGNSTRQPLIFCTSTTTCTWNVASGSTLAYVAIMRTTFAGNAVVATNSFDLGGNNMAGGSITFPTGGGARPSIF
jgi:hypothetical protein